MSAPWALLLLLSTRPGAAAAHGTATGAVVLAVGGAASLLAYRLMLRIARLPAQRGCVGRVGPAGVPAVRYCRAWSTAASLSRTTPPIRRAFMVLRLARMVGGC